MPVQLVPGMSVHERPAMEHPEHLHLGNFSSTQASYPTPPEKTCHSEYVRLEGGSDWHDDAFTGGLPLTPAPQEDMLRSPAEMLRAPREGLGEMNTDAYYTGHERPTAQLPPFVGHDITAFIETSAFFGNIEKDVRASLALDAYVCREYRNSDNGMDVVPITMATQDKIRSIAYRLLRKATNRGKKTGPAPLPTDPNTRVTLPSRETLSFLLRRHGHSLHSFYSLEFNDHMDPNEMVSDDKTGWNRQVSALQLLLMCAEGASVIESAEGRDFCTALMAIGSLSLGDMMRKNNTKLTDPILRCALLSMLMGAWSGDELLTNKAQVERAMYMEMIRQLLMLEPRPLPSRLTSPSYHIEQQWHTWQEEEYKTRLLHNWVIADQELALFQDRPTQLAIKELCAPLPGPEVLWHSRNADDWAKALESYYSMDPLNELSERHSLNRLFQDFLGGQLNAQPGCLTGHELRLLLHPLQNLVYQDKQLWSCFAALPSSNTPRGVRMMTKASTWNRLEEVQTLLQKWKELSNFYVDKEPECVVGKTNIIMYHLINVSAVTDFTAIKRLARREEINLSSPYVGLLNLQGNCIIYRETAFFHSGQVLRQLRTLPKECQPGWWCAAVYHAILVFWTDSIATRDPEFRGREEKGNLWVSIDHAPVGDEALDQFINGDGIPVLGLRGDPAGTAPVSLDSPSDILKYGIEMIRSHGASTMLASQLINDLILIDMNWT